MITYIKNEITKLEGRRFLLYLEKDKTDCLTKTVKLSSEISDLDSKIQNFNSALSSKSVRNVSMRILELQLDIEKIKEARLYSRTVRQYQKHSESVKLLEERIKSLEKLIKE